MKYEQTEDPVVNLFPVCLSLPENGELYLLQHPNQGDDDLSIDGSITKARLRPSCHQLEVEQDVENNRVYNYSVGEQQALNADGAYRDRRDASDNYFQSGIMDKSVLRSEGSLEDPSRYVAAEFIPGVGFVVVPLSAVLPLRSALDYIDKADARVKSEKKAEEEAEEGTNTEDTTRAVTVRFERPENDKMKSARERSFFHHQRKIMEEPWINLQCFSYGDSYGEHLREQTFEAVEEEVHPFHLPPSHFMSLLAPPAAAAGPLTPSLKADPRATTQTSLHSFPVEQQVFCVMQKVGVAKYVEILDYLEPEVRRHETSLIEKIQMSATLVQGCWVLKSDLLYPTPESVAAAASGVATMGRPLVEVSSSSSSSRRHGSLNNCRYMTESGTAHADMQKAREYALYLLSTQGWLDHDQLQKVTPLPGSDMLAMLAGIAKPDNTDDCGKRTGRWTFLLDTDHQFIRLNKEVDQRYAMKWEYQFRTRITPRIANPPVTKCHLHISIGGGTCLPPGALRRSPSSQSCVVDCYSAMSCTVTPLKPHPASKSCGVDCYSAMSCTVTPLKPHPASKSCGVDCYSAMSCTVTPLKPHSASKSCSLFLGS
ncbi:DNA-directed RNA polymerase III subunit Rpc5 [Trinorchestia longiramus]|nr:DNA-directed RNA polymerase III subunit Rpc5 [Trinorchestia longiramus]